MLISCWSVKGGSGTTVVAVALASTMRLPSSGVLLVDLVGDVPTMLAVPESLAPVGGSSVEAAVDDIDDVARAGSAPPMAGSRSSGIADWLAAGADVPADALARLEQPLDSEFSLLPRGQAAYVDGARVDVLMSVLSSDARPVVVDAGVPWDSWRSSSPTGSRSVALAAIAAASHSLLVIRPCLLALRRAVEVPIRPSGIIVVAEPGRSLSPLDVEEALGAPVRAVVRFEPAVARAVDAGTLLSAPPKSLARGLRDAI